MSVVFMVWTKKVHTAPSKGSYQTQWVSAVDGGTESGGKAQGESAISFNSPIEGGNVLLLKLMH